MTPLRVWGWNIVQNPTVNDVTDENPVQLDQNKSASTAHMARCLFFIQDRADTTFAVNELCRKLSDPAHHSFANLKRPLRYLKGERQWIQVFQIRGHEFRSDSFL